MKIAFVEIQNFRKLKACRVEIAKQETIFVGANNSGKTSAMDALILFLKKSRRKDFVTTKPIPMVKTKKMVVYGVEEPALVLSLSLSLS